MSMAQPAESLIPRLLRWEMQLQYRHYFFHAAIILSLVWVGLFQFLSEDLARVWMPVLIFTDIGTIGLTFVVGVLFLDKRQDTLSVISVMPISTALWITVKVLALSILSTVCGLVLVVLHLNEVNWLQVVPVVFATAMFYTLLGFLIACPFDKLTSYFLLMALTLAITQIPLLAYFEIYSSPLFWLIPTQAILNLLAGSLSSMSAISFLGNFLLLSFWIMLLFWFSIRAFHKYVSQRRH